MQLAHRTGAGAEAASARASAGASARVSAPRLTPVPLAEAFGRTLAADLRALFDVPHYDSSAMDGCAVAGPPPWILDDSPPHPSAPLLPGRARTVVTGGPVPAGASGVVRSEYTDTALHEDGVRIDL